MREQDQQDYSGFDPPYAPTGRYNSPSPRDEVLRAVHRRRMLHEIVQSVIGEIDYTGTAREDSVWWTLHDLHDANGLPEGITADDCFNLFWTNYHNSGEQ